MHCNHDFLAVNSFMLNWLKECKAKSGGWLGMDRVTRKIDEIIQ